MSGAFAAWQPLYARHGVATFPVKIADGDKKPAITDWNKVGLRASEQLAIKFPTASAFAFNCGRHNRLTVVDLDSTDEAIVREGERLFGPSPLLWRTGSGKFAMAFRFNGEGRRIRPITSLPIDLLGAGPCVAPGSVGAKRQYEIIRGSLDDLDRLPIARRPQLGSRPADRIPEGRRNNELFAYCRSVVGYCDDREQLIDAVRTWAADRLAAPLPDAELVKTCASVWNYRENRKRIGSRMVEEDLYRALATEPAVAGVAMVLLAENGPGSEFMISDGLAEKWGWPRRLLPTARARLLELGAVRRTRRRGRQGPWLYRWQLPGPEGEGRG